MNTPSLRLPRRSLPTLPGLPRLPKLPRLPELPSLPGLPALPKLQLSSLTVPPFALPPLVAAIGTRLPQWPHAIPIVVALNTLQRAGAIDASQMAVLENRRFRIKVTDAGTVADFTVRNGHFIPLIGTAANIAPDLCFAAALSAFLQLLARQEDPDTLFFDRRLAIEGDTELSLHVKNMFDAIDFDALRERLPAPLKSLVGVFSASAASPNP
jgi:predicted lipid carrier protein YhbT